MVDASRSVPGRPHIPFHIRIVCKQFTLRIQGNVVLIAEAHGQQLPIGAVGADFGNPATRSHDANRVATGVPHARQQLVFAPDRGHSRRGKLRGGRMVPTGNDQGLTVRRKNDGMRAVFVAALQGSQVFGTVVLAVAVGVTNAVQADSRASPLLVITYRLSKAQSKP